MLGFPHGWSSARRRFCCWGQAAALIAENAINARSMHTKTPRDLDLGNARRVQLAHLGGLIARRGLPSLVFALCLRPCNADTLAFQHYFALELRHCREHVQHGSTGCSAGINAHPLIPRRPAISTF